MIAFSCRQCGKVYERPPHEAGTLVFCDCGASNTVPWESIPLASPVPPEQYEPNPVPAIPAVGCFNHADVRSEHICSGCGLDFCSNCVVHLDQRLLCGPCKNFHLRSLSRPPEMSLAALFALIIALLAAPFTLVLLVASMGMASADAVIIFALIGLVPQMLAMLLGVYALGHVEGEKPRGGGGLAISAVVTSLVTTILTVELAIHFLRALG